MKILLSLLLIPLLSPAAFGFCGFYVAKADSKLFNKASQVVLARYGERTVMTMANDYQGDPKEFAIVIPVPTVVQKDAVQVADKALIEHVDAYSAPRLVEYFDENPCRPRPRMFFGAPGGSEAMTRARADGAKALGVKIEASYSVGEYDILILSAEESGGLETWLTESGYKIPKGAGEVLASYIKQNMKFFVAKVNLARHEAGGFTYLRPLRVEFSTPKFMLPIRLGTVNANGPQELFIYTFTRNGRVETTNYRTVKLPSDTEVPLFVRDDFPRFYRDLFAHAVRREEMRTLFTEYAWDTGWCDPCAADPLTCGELRKLGVEWVDGKGSDRPEQGAVFLTRLHLRYDREHFPEDLVFQETGDIVTFQGRYVMRHPWKGEPKMQAGGRVPREAAQGTRNGGSKPCEADRLEYRHDTGASRRIRGESEDPEEPLTRTSDSRIIRNTTAASIGGAEKLMMNLRGLQISTALLAFTIFGCKREVIVIEKSPPTPAQAPASRTETIETSRLGATINAFEREPTAENRTAAKKAFADLDGEIAELEEHVAKRTGGEREEAAVKLRNLQAYRTAETARFTAAEVKSPNVPSAPPDSRTGAQKLENTAEKIGDKLENAARKAGDAIEDVVK